MNLKQQRKVSNRAHLWSMRNDDSSPKFDRCPTLGKGACSQSQRLTTDSLFLWDEIIFQLTVFRFLTGRPHFSLRQTLLAGNLYTQTMSTPAAVPWVRRLLLSQKVLSFLSTHRKPTHSQSSPALPGGKGLLYWWVGRIYCSYCFTATLHMRPPENGFFFVLLQILKLLFGFLKIFLAD